MPTSERKPKLIMDINPSSFISEAFRTLRTNIQFSSTDQQVKTILVTSPSAGEGKSTVIANLAIAYSQDNKRVVIIDADLRRPILHQFYNRPNTPGLSNLLAGQIALRDAINDTQFENLYFLPSGPTPPNPSGMLGSSRMNTLISELKKLFDVILIDSAPSLIVSDAQILSSCCDGVILVLSSGKVRLGKAKKTIAKLEHAKANLLGVVLNNVSQSKKVESFYTYL